MGSILPAMVLSLAGLLITNLPAAAVGAPGNASASPQVLADGSVSERPLLIASHVEVGAIDPATQHPSPTKAAVKSLILPGWGQAQSHRSSKYWLLGEVVLVGAGVAAGIHLDSRAGDYDQALTAYDRAREQYRIAVDPGRAQEAYDQMEMAHAAASSRYDDYTHAQTIFLIGVGALASYHLVSGINALRGAREATGSDRDGAEAQATSPKLFFSWAPPPIATAESGWRTGILATW